MEMIINIVGAYLIGLFCGYLIADKKADNLKNQLYWKNQTIKDLWDRIEALNKQIRGAKR